MKTGDPDHHLDSLAVAIVIGSMTGLVGGDYLIQYETSAIVGSLANKIRTMLCQGYADDYKPSVNS